MDHRRIISIKYFTLLWPKYVAKGVRELVSSPWQKGTHTHTLPLRTYCKPVRSTKRLAFFKPPEVRLHDNFWQPQHVIQTHCELTPSVSQIHSSNHIKHRGDFGRVYIKQPISCEVHWSIMYVGKCIICHNSPILIFFGICFTQRVKL